MGRQSSRIYWQGQDHKEMVTWNGREFQYHDKAYIWTGNAFQLVWEKLAYTAIADKIDGLVFANNFVPYESANYYVGFYYYDSFNTEFPQNTLIRVDKEDYGKESLITTERTTFGGFVNSKIFLYVYDTESRPQKKGGLIYDVENNAPIMATDSFLSNGLTTDYGKYTHKIATENNGNISSMCTVAVNDSSGTTKYYASYVIANPNQVSCGEHSSIIPMCTATNSQYRVAQPIDGIDYYGIDGTGQYVAVIRDWGEGYSEIISEQSLIDITGIQPDYYNDWYFDNGFIVLTPDLWVGLPWKDTAIVDLRQMKMVKKINLSDIARQVGTGGVSSQNFNVHPKSAEFIYHIRDTNNTYKKDFDDEDTDAWKTVDYRPSRPGNQQISNVCYMNDDVFFVLETYNGTSRWQGYKFRKKEDE